jgi:hypothetical protein
LVLRLPSLQLESKVLGRVQSHRPLDLWLNILEAFQALWFLNWAQVDHIVADNKGLLGSEVKEALHDSYMRVVLALLQVDPSLQLSIFGEIRIEDTATPVRWLLVCDDVETGDDSKVALSTANRAEQICVFVFVCVHDLPGCENNLDIGNVVACEAELR